MIACPNCRTILPVQIANTGQLHKCRNCMTLVRGELFNAFHRPVSEGANGEHVQVQGQAECFYHPGKKAVVPCSSCGRLLCALCEIPFDGRSLCTNCLKSGRDKKQITSIEKNRFLYDSLALNLAFWPMFTIWFTFITAPAVVFVVLRYWKAPNSILPRTKFRFIIAMLLAVAQMVAWVVAIVALVN